MRLDVLDHGFIELLDTMGDEREIARAARISYGGVDEERTWEQDARLIRYLWKNKHTSPFEMVELKWRVKMPIFVARQWIRHRTANVNEFSMRYAEPSALSEGEDIEFYEPEHWRLQSTLNHQDSFGIVVDNPDIHDDYLEAIALCFHAYNELIEAGVAREMARMVLPVSVYTEMVWKNDLHNTLHFLKLRADSHAQAEIRWYAEAMLKILFQKFPNLMPILWEEGYLEITRANVPCAYTSST